MVFTSFAFLKFFVVVFIGLWLTRTRTLRQLLILVASAFFYAYWKPAYLLLLLTPSMIDYWCSIHIEDTDNPSRRRAWLLVSLITNLGLLAYFKYTNFFIDNIALLLGRQIPHLDIVLPVGISFYTFKTLSYTIDVYWKHIPACRSLWKYAMFVTYFPELVAGPIVRASVFLPQMNRSLRPSWSRTLLGLQVVLLGVTKKLVIADRMAGLVDPIFADPAAYTPFTIISAVIAYSLQIYCDFSGYSDIAIGVSKIIGFDLPENFNMPYLATSLTDFWRRWHMTLSGWLRDYLYIPLGGNRHGRLKTYRNLMITMLLGGLWHGASWNFVFWGLLHGCGLAVNHWWTRDRRGAADLGEKSPLVHRFRLVVGWLATYVFVCFAWIFFRSRDLNTSLLIVRKILYLDTSGSPWFYSPLYMLLPLVVAAHILGTMAAKQGLVFGTTVRWIEPPGWAVPLYSLCRKRFAVKPSKAAGIYVLAPVPGFLGGFILAIWLIGVYLFSSLHTSPFIYFQF
jgi:alginate O-acetyltransferase complex protein AlgI